VDYLKRHSIPAERHTKLTETIFGRSSTVVLMEEGFLSKCEDAWKSKEKRPDIKAISMSITPASGRRLIAKLDRFENP